MDKHYLASQHWPMSRNPLAFRGREAKLCENGWFSHNFMAVSGIEYRATAKKVGEFGDNAIITGLHKSPYQLVEIGNNRLYFTDNSFSVWTRLLDDLDNIVAVFDEQPKRTVELVVDDPEQFKIISVLLKGDNHRSVILEDDPDFPSKTKWMISTEPSVGAVQAKLML